MATVTLNVPDISCAHCERTIIQALTPLYGVRGVHVDIPAKQVQVDYDEDVVDLERLGEILEAADYPVAAAEPRER